MYYFAFAGGYDGPPPLYLGGKPSRRVLWLRKDRGVFRTVCDGQDYTVPIRSGAHPGYKPDPGEPFDQVILDILLTRGQGQVDNHKFAEAVENGVGISGVQEYTIEKLRHLALTESSEVKYAACEVLWNFSGEKLDDRLRQRAGDSLRAAGCKCGLNPSVGVVCQ